MALTLNQTLLRLTAANNYGVPPLSGSVSLSQGTGIVNTPNPITGTGTIALAVPVAVANGGTGITTGTSGGLLYFSGAGTIASSPALTTNQLLVGAGAGNPPVGLGTLGTTTTLLHGNAAGLPTFGAVSLTTDVSGILPVGSGGSGTSTALTQGSVIFAGASGVYSQDNANFFWDATNHRLGVGIAVPVGGRLHDVHNIAGEANAVLEAGASMSPAVEFKDSNATPNRWRIGSGWNTVTDGFFFIQDKRQAALRLLVDGSGNIGIGTAAPTSLLTVNGTIELKSGSGGVLKFADGTSQASAAAGGGTVTGTGTATNVAFWSAGSTISSDNGLYWDNTNKRLGVGTNTPAGNFHSKSNTFPCIIECDTATTAPTSILIRGATDNNRFLILGYNTTSEYGSIQANNLGTGVKPLVLNISGGSVGVGKIPSLALLDVAGNAAIKDTLLLYGATSGYWALKAAATSSSVTLTLPAGDSTGTQYLRSNGAGVLSWGTPAGAGTVTSSASPSAGTVAYFTTSTDITGTGSLFWSTVNSRLGINNSSPLAPLHVGAASGAAALTSQVLLDTNGASYLTAKDVSDSTEAAFGADATGAIVGSQTASPLNFQTSGVARGSFQATGAFRLNGSSSGYIGLQGAAAAGSTTFTLPAADGIANQVLRTNGAATLAFGNATQGVYDVTGYGAVADGKVAQDGAMDNNVTFNLTCASAPFTSADVGKAISVSGAGAAGTLAYGTITGFTSTSVVTVSFGGNKNISGAAISSKTVSWGTDNTTAFTNACAAANTTPAFGAVYAPPGTYRVSTHFTVPVGVRFFGNGVGPKWSTYGTVIHQVEGYGSAAGTACISVGFNATLEGIAMYSPHQVSSGTPIAYPFSVKGAAYATIRNIFFYNAYQGVDVASEVNNPYNGAFTIRGLYGEPLALGIDVNTSYDTSEISDVHFWPFWSLNEATMAAWKRDNAIGIRFGRSDYQLMDNVYIGNMGIGVQLNHNASIAAGGTSGTWTNIQLDSCHIGIDAYETGYNGLLISNLYCSGVNLAGTHYGIKTNAHATQYVILTVANAHFWSNLSYGIYIDNQSGLHSFNQMQFHQASNTHAYINRGATSLTNSWFLPSGGAGINVLAGCAEKVMLTCNQLFGTSKTVSNATTLDANNQA